MEIPKEIDDLLEKRAQAALEFTAYDSEIVDWLFKNNIEVSSDHILTGACSIMEPVASINIIRKCILEKED